MSPQKQENMTLRTGHFERMTITFRAGNVLHGTQILVGLKTKDIDAMPADTADGPRHLSLTFNPNTEDLTISETRGATSSTLRKGVMLPAGSYTVLENRIQNENTWLLTLRSSLPIQIQNGYAQNGELLIEAQKRRNKKETTRIMRRMRESLILGQWETWFASRTVNHVEVRVPNCDNSVHVDMDEVVRLFDRFRATEQDESSFDTENAEAVGANETGWEDDMVVGTGTKGTGKKLEVSSQPLDLEEVPDNWFDR